MSRKILLSILAIAVVVGLVGVGTYAVWSDTVASEGNQFSAGTLKLDVGGIRSPSTLPATILNDMYPGWSTTLEEFKVKNVGTVPGKLSVGVSALTDSDPATPISNYVWYEIEEYSGGAWAPAYAGWLSSLNGSSVAMGDLAASAERTFRVKVTMVTGAPNETQGDSCKFVAAWSLTQP